ncbi:MAG: ArnT family glycosyltransferase [Rhodospirillales bacterium]
MTAKFEPLAPALLFAVFVSALGPWWAAFELDPDEGFNLMKAALAADGYALFSEIWSDQPPLFTWALAALHALFGAEIAAARGLVLASACVLIAALFIVVRAVDGPLGAWTACIVLGSGFLFQGLSVSVMVGLPAIALVMCAFAALAREDESADISTAALVVSGALMALALQTKLFTAAALPAGMFAAALAAGAGNTHGWRGRGRRLGVWLGAVAAVWFAVTLASGLSPAAHLIGPHTGASLAEAFQYDGGPGRFWSLLTAQPQYLIAGAAGLLITLPFKDARRWIPLLWLALAGAALTGHRPLWPHQMLLVLVPLAWLAGGAGRRLHPARWKDSHPRALASGLAAAAVIWGAVWQAPVTHKRLSAPADPLDTAAVQALRERGAGVEWIITDKPLDAWYAGLRTPPPLAVLSLKRVKGGALTAAQTADYAREYKPGLVSYRRMYMGKPMAALMKESYTQVSGLRRHALFVRD